MQADHHSQYFQRWLSNIIFGATPLSPNHLRATTKVSDSRLPKVYGVVVLSCCPAFTHISVICLGLTGIRRQAVTDFQFIPRYTLLSTLCLPGTSLTRVYVGTYFVPFILGFSPRKLRPFACQHYHPSTLNICDKIGVETNDTIHHHSILIWPLQYIPNICNPK